MDAHPLSPSTIDYLRAPLEPADRLASDGIRQALDDAFCGSTEAFELDQATAVQLGPLEWSHFFSELPSLAVETLVLELGVSPIHATGAQLQQVLYTLMPAAVWFDGYEREDLLSFVAYWSWMTRVIGGPALEAGRRVCGQALADFDRGALPARVPEAA